MDFKEFTLDNGQRIRLATVTGTVVSAKTSRSVTVTQGDPLVLSKDVALPGSITTTVRTRQGLWLQDDRGQERFYKLGGFELPAREGHDVSILFGAPAGSSDASIFGAMNHTSGDAVCDVMVLGTALRAWRFQIGTVSSFLMWTLLPALVIGLLVLMGAGGKFDQRLGYAVISAIACVIAGPILWMLIGFNLGPGSRMNELASQINQLGRTALAQAGSHLA
ncbi:hypothetical protein ACQ859_03245 [Roseateles chitinivorans]|uniref:hypothetical protein n=1 Tax=Roseateles chitinivorans TaxID=2917965 RepID=UPI003D67E0A0